MAQLLSRIPFLRHRSQRQLRTFSHQQQQDPPNSAPTQNPEPFPVKNSHQRYEAVKLDQILRIDDGFWTAIASGVKIFLCFIVVMTVCSLWIILLVFLLPWPYERIRQGNICGRVASRLVLWILGNPVEIRGMQHANTKAIYICNHTSPLDIFLVMWLVPPRTVGVAKKEIIWYPFFGLLYFLANHIRLDRSNSSSSIQSMRQAAKTVLERNLSLLIFPEGTRSATGRLLPFKKGFVHLAIQTKRPIVPMVLTGTHLAWQKNSLQLRRAPLTVTFLPPLKTDDWTVDKVDDYVKLLHDTYVEHLPKSQAPLEALVKES